MGGMLTTKTKGRGRRAGGSYRPMSDINVTPFVDVMLVLLIVFMVAAPLLTAGVPVDLPNSKAQAINDDDNRPIEVSITKDSEIYIGESQVKDGTLIQLLSAMTEDNKERRIYVRGDQALPYGQVMQVIGSINAAGFRKVALISNNKS